MKNPRRPRRSGTILIVALVCLVVVMALVGLLLQGTLRARRQLRVERDRRQAELLLEAGLRRAVHRLANEPDYREETWRLPADEVVGTGQAEVTIRATRSAEDQPWRLAVSAEYPLGDELSIRRSRTILVPIEE